MIRLFLRAAARLPVLLTVAGALISLTLAAEGKPNIVVFLSDDHTAADSSVYGSKDVVTPSMERVARDGLVFDRAFVASPSCAPSRAALLTGLMPARNGAEANHARPDANIKKLPAYLQELGYEVVAIGKVGHYKQTAEYGFDYTAHMGYHEDVAVPAALDWLRARKSGKPLALFVGTNWPHVPWPEPEAGKAASEVVVPPTQVDTPATREARLRYYAGIARMDAELGQVYDLAREKLGEDTFFIHTSDHGAQFPFSKWTCYESGIRSPLIVVWPGVVKPGTRTNAMVSWVDILPTLLEAAGGTAPADLDGRSFLPVLRGQSDSRREKIFVTHSGDGNMNVYPTRAVRDRRWKLILNLHPEFQFNTHVNKGRAREEFYYWGSWTAKAESDPAAAAAVKRYHQHPALELYDLESDPAELKNLAAEPAQAPRVKAMRAELEAWMRVQGDEGRVYGNPTLLPVR
ncbi:MAG: sulfatase [Verrucomicrobiota bacterium]